MRWRRFVAAVAAVIIVGLAASGVAAAGLGCATLSQALSPSPRLGDAGLGPAIQERQWLADGRLLLIVRRPALLLGAGAGDVRPTLEAVYEAATAQAGFQPALRSLVVDLSRGDVAAGGAAVATGAASVRLELPASLDGAALHAALAHQFGHALSFSYGPASAWWAEASADWLAAMAGFAAPQSTSQIWRSEASPLDDRVAASKLYTYLVDRFGARVVADTWMEIAARADGDALAALQRVMAARDTNLGDELESYAAWLLVRGRAEGRDPVATRLGELPARVEVASDVPGPLGVSFLSVRSPEAPGGLRLVFDGDSRLDWSVMALTVPRGQRQPKERSSLDVSSSGRAVGVVPAEDADEVVVAVINRSLDPADGSAFVLRAALLPRYPFVLDGIDLEPSRDGRIDLRWATLSESDVYGWRVLRGGPDGAGFQPLSEALVPAAGDAGIYSLTDDEVERGRTYAYVIEAVTGLGFTSRTQVVYARVPSE